DYHPGETATLSGQGWKPGETVTLTVASFPLDEHRTEFTATAEADGNGQVRFAGFSIDRSHAGVRFLAHATGSEPSAQTSFTDTPFIDYDTHTSLDVARNVQLYGNTVTLTALVTATVTGTNVPAPAPFNGQVTFYRDGLALPSPSSTGADGAAVYNLSTPY